MSGLELALIVFVVILVVVMLVRDAETKNRLDQLEAEVAGLDRTVEKLGKRMFLTNVQITPLDAEGKPSGPAVPWGPQHGPNPFGGDAGSDPH